MVPTIMRPTALACLAVALMLPRLAPASPYSVKDAGPVPAPLYYNDFFIQARHFAPRIDAEGEVSTRDSYSADYNPGKLGSITAPYRPGLMGLYTESADALPGRLGHGRASRGRVASLAVGQSGRDGRGPGPGPEHPRLQRAHPT
jgi:hypothetical protein